MDSSMMSNHKNQGNVLIQPPNNNNYYHQSPMQNFYNKPNTGPFIPNNKHSNYPPTASNETSYNLNGPSMKNNSPPQNPNSGYHPNSSNNGINGPRPNGPLNGPGPDGNNNNINYFRSNSNSGGSPPHNPHYHRNLSGGVDNSNHPYHHNSPYHNHNNTGYIPRNSNNNSRNGSPPNVSMPIGMGPKNNISTGYTPRNNNYLNNQKSPTNTGYIPKNNNNSGYTPGNNGNHSGYQGLGGAGPNAQNNNNNNNNNNNGGIYLKRNQIGSPNHQYSNHSGSPRNNGSSSNGSSLHGSNGSGGGKNNSGKKDRKDRHDQVNSPNELIFEKNPVLNDIVYNGLLSKSKSANKNNNNNNIEADVNNHNTHPQQQNHHHHQNQQSDSRNMPSSNYGASTSHDLNGLTNTNTASNSIEAQNGPHNNNNNNMKNLQNNIANKINFQKRYFAENTTNQKLLEKLQQVESNYELHKDNLISSQECMINLLEVYAQIFKVATKFSIENGLNQKFWDIAKKEVKEYQTIQDNYNKNQRNPNLINDSSLKARINNRQDIMKLLQSFYENIIETMHMRLYGELGQGPMSIKYVKSMHPELINPKENHRYSKDLLQDCYVHLGDIYRYTSQVDTPKLKKSYLQYANDYYKMASSLDKSKGQPYNQMAILYCNKAEFFHVIFYWCKALDAKIKFAPAQQNLVKQLTKCLGRPQFSVQDSVNENKTNLPNKRIEDAKKYFLRSFARAYLHHPKQHINYVLSLQDFLDVNQLFGKVTIRSKNLGWFYLKVSYLYIWLYASNNINEEFKIMLLKALENFVCIMIDNRSALEIERLMPAIRLVLEWLDKNQKNESMKNIADNYFKIFNNIDNATLYQDNLRIALSEGEEINGMRSFAAVRATLVDKDYSNIHTVQAEKCIVYSILKEYLDVVPEPEKMPILNIKDNMLNQVNKQSQQMNREGSPKFNNQQTQLQHQNSTQRNHHTNNIFEQPIIEEEPPMMNHPQVNNMTHNNHTRNINHKPKTQNPPPGFSNNFFNKDDDVKFKNENKNHTMKNIFEQTSNDISTEQISNMSNQQFSINSMTEEGDEVNDLFSALATEINDKNETTRLPQRGSSNNHHPYANQNNNNNLNNNTINNNNNQNLNPQNRALPQNYNNNHNNNNNAPNRQNHSINNSSNNNSYSSNHMNNGYLPNQPPPTNNHQNNHHNNVNVNANSRHHQNLVNPINSSNYGGKNHNVENLFDFQENPSNHTGSGDDLYTLKNNDEFDIESKIKDIWA